nr:T-cell receptor delta chain VDJ junction region [mice, liver, gamma delta T cells, 95BLT-4, Peptide Partial, 16 aa] [Mus sp.]
ALWEHYIGGIRATDKL